jgi:hypothetical protein
MIPFLFSVQKLLLLSLRTWLHLGTPLLPSPVWAAVISCWSLRRVWLDLSVLLLVPSWGSSHQSSSSNPRRKSPSPCWVLLLHLDRQVGSSQGLLRLSVSTILHPLACLPTQWGASQRARPASPQVSLPFARGALADSLSEMCLPGLLDADVHLSLLSSWLCFPALCLFAEHLPSSCSHPLLPLEAPHHIWVFAALG